VARAAIRFICAARRVAKSSAVGVGGGDAAGVGALGVELVGLVVVGGAVATRPSSTAFARG
jgi:hypothetical protein